jgi:hypothetical protein
MSIPASPFSLDPSLSQFVPSKTHVEIELPFGAEGTTQEAEHVRGPKFNPQYHKKKKKKKKNKFNCHCNVIKR